MLRYFQLLIFFISFSTGISNQNIAQKIEFPSKVFLNDENSYIAKNLVIVKLMAENNHELTTNALLLKQFTQSKFANAEITVKPMFPNRQMLEKSEKEKQFVDLTLFFLIESKDEFAVTNMVSELEKQPYVQYAQPYYIPTLFATPNDPFIVYQYYLQKLKVYDAWDITQGDTNMVIGIVDTGIDLFHPDIKQNIKFNYDDPIDGYDNDNDGFLDNFYGWDLGTNDNLPQVNLTVQQGGHGVNVAGAAAATVNNGTGIAGVGNLCKILPVKIQDDNGYLTMAYQGIVYAADHGCKVINCSWGNIRYPGQFGQDIINYATFNKDALVIAASGNSNGEHDYFPASYKNVLSVANVDSFDLKFTNSPGGSTFSYNVDVSAPGTAIYTTHANGSYTYATGTSFSSPVAAGAAAIVRSKYKQFSALQSAALLKATTDMIDTIPYNRIYAGKLGTGRINLLSALQNDTTPYIEMTTCNQPDSYFANKEAGDTIEFSGNFINWLFQANNVEVTISCTNPNVLILDSVASLGNFACLESKSNLSQPFRMKLLNSTNACEKVVVKLSCTAQNYKSKQYYTFIVNKDYIDINIGNIGTTLTSKGRIGYNDELNEQGIGFLNNTSQSLLSCSGLLIGNSSSRVSDNVYAASINDYDNDFNVIKKVILINPSTWGDFNAISHFSDDNAGINKLGVEVWQYTYGFSSNELSNCIVLEYYIKNTNNNPLYGVYAGIFTDWDIRNYRNNRVSFAEELQLGYAFDVEQTKHVGIKLLSEAPIKFYAINNDGNENSFSITDGFSTTEKYIALKNQNVINHQAGAIGCGADISMILSAGPLTINANDSVKVAFAMLAHNHYFGLKQVAENIQIAYNQWQDVNNKTIKNQNSYLQSCFPNPVSSQLNISCIIEDRETVEIAIHNVFGKKMIEICNQTLEKGYHHFKQSINSLPCGTYYCTFKTSKVFQTQKIIIIN